MAIWPLNYKASQYHSTWGRPNCLSQQNSTIPPGTALALQQLFSSAAFLCCYTKQAIWMHNTFPLFFCTVWFSFHTGIFFPHKHVTKVILDAEGKSANSSMHSQGTPGSTHRPVLFKAAPLVCEHFHLLFTMSECFIWSELLTTSPQHHPKRWSHLQITLFFP